MLGLMALFVAVVIVVWLDVLLPGSVADTSVAAVACHFKVKAWVLRQVPNWSRSIRHDCYCTGLHSCHDSGHVIFYHHVRQHSLHAHRHVRHSTYTVSPGTPSLNPTPCI